MPSFLINNSVKPSNKSQSLSNSEAKLPVKIKPRSIVVHPEFGANCNDFKDEKNNDKIAQDFSDPDESKDIDCYDECKKNDKTSKNFQTCIAQFKRGGKRKSKKYHNKKKKTKRKRSYSSKKT